MGFVVQKITTYENCCCAARDKREEIDQIDDYDTKIKGDD